MEAHDFIHILPTATLSFAKHSESSVDKTGERISCIRRRRHNDFCDQEEDATSNSRSDDKVEKRVTKEQENTANHTLTAVKALKATVFFNRLLNMAFNPM